MEEPQLVRLQGDGMFPEDIALAALPAFEAPKRGRIATISAHDFQDYPGEYGFGVDKSKVAGELRRIAAAVEHGQAIVHRVQVTTEGQQAEYTRSALILEFTAKTRL